MNSASYIGRIGGLAVALGVGAAVFAGQGIACAATGGSEAAESSNTGDNNDNNTSGTETTTTETSTGTTDDDTEPDDVNEDDTDEDAVDQGALDEGTVDGDVVDEEETGTDGSNPTTEPEPEAPAENAGGDNDVVLDVEEPSKNYPSTEQAADSAKEEAALDEEVVDEVVQDAPVTNVGKSSLTGSTKAATKVSTFTVTNDANAIPESAIAGLSTQSAPEETVKPFAALVQRIADLFSNNNSSNTPAGAGPFAWVMAAAARRELSGAQAEVPEDVTMTLNGYYVVPTSTVYVKSFYGLYTNFPGFPGVVQGEQEFDLVDPETGDSVGHFKALVSKNNDMTGNKVLTQLLVTDSTPIEGYTTGSEPGDTPPVGSVIASHGTGQFGTVYYAMPNDDGGNDVSYKRVTRFGTFKLFGPFDAAFDQTDFGSFNRPVRTADGFYVAPTVEDSAQFTSIIGYPPFFSAVQGIQQFTVYGDDGSENGTFDGLMTVTSDVLGTYTAAIYVIDNDGTNVGTEAGQTPPIGTVYNVIYFPNGKRFIIYTSKPAGEGAPDVVSTKFVTPRRVSDLDLDFDASTPPDRDELVVPGAYRFVPYGDKQVVGVNGLPPREVIIQGYQQFEVYDSEDNYLGIVNADTSSQWELSGDSTEAILVTGFDSVDPDADASDLPPVGSVFNFKYMGVTGFGTAYSAIPTESGEGIVRNYVVTPYGSFRIPTGGYDASKGLADYDYYIPPAFGDPEMSGMSAQMFSAGATAGLLGANQFDCNWLDADNCAVA